MNKLFSPKGSLKMKACALLVSLIFSSAHADQIPRTIPYNLCADKTNSECKSLYMPSIGQINAAAGMAIFKCDRGCLGEAKLKALGAINLLAPRARDLDYSHFLTYETDPNILVYVPNKQSAENFERVVIKSGNNSVTLYYCQFYSSDINATIKNYQTKHNVQAGKSTIYSSPYANLKAAFKAQEDKSLCEDL